MTGRINRMILIPAAILSAWAVLPSCSTILEDRSDCPCILTVNTARIPQATGILSPVEEGDLRISLITEEGSPIISDKAVRRMDRRSENEYSTRVRKSMAVLSSTIGGKHYRTSSDKRSMVLEEGYEADSVYVHLNSVDCLGETAYDTLKVHKEWCTVNIFLKGNDHGKRYSFTMEGQWNGFSLGTALSPLKGKFNCETRKLSSDNFQARIPRQGDDSLILRMYEDDANGIHYREISSFPLGYLIMKAGFDWFRRDLHDIDITIDQSSLSIGIQVCPWYGGTNLGDMEL